MHLLRDSYDVVCSSQLFNTVLRPGQENVMFVFPFLSEHIAFILEFQLQEFIRRSPQTTVTTIWKTPVCKRGIFKRPVSYVMNFRGWIKLIYDKITLNCSIKNEFNPTSEVQNIETEAFQNVPFANGSFPNGGYSCLWAKLVNIP